MEIELLKAFLNKIYPLSTTELDAFTSNWQTITVKRKTILTAAGEKERYLYFVLEGVQRAFYLGDDNKEATIVLPILHHLVALPIVFSHKQPPFIF